VKKREHEQPARVSHFRHHLLSFLQAPEEEEDESDDEEGDDRGGNRLMMLMQLLRSGQVLFQ
jgi:hypothetical protein